MKKFLAALFVLALAITSYQSAEAQNGIWGEPVLLKWRTFKAADPNGGATDSTEIHNGAVNDLDTSLAFRLDLPQWRATADSTPLQTWIRVTVVGTQAFASGESLYYTFDGNAGADVWTSQGISACGTCNTGGYAKAMALIPGTDKAASQLGIPYGSSVAVGVASGLVYPTAIYYGPLYAYATLRMRLHSDYVVAPVDQLIRVYVQALTGKYPNAPPNQ